MLRERSEARRQGSKGPRRRVFGDGSVGIGSIGPGEFGLTVELHVRLPDLETDEAERIVKLAHQACPYSNAVRGNVDVQLSVDPAPEVI